MPFALVGIPDYFEKWGVTFTLHPGWETRSRSSGDFTDGKPKGVVVHHTASNTTLSNDINWMWHTSPSRPIGNFLLARTGLWVVGAAGASNTNGKGGPWLTSSGVIGQDTGNSQLAAVEAQNDGVGEAWPIVMQDSYVQGVAAICDYLQTELGVPMFRAGKDVMAHFEWGNVTIPNRKNDPAGPSRYAGPGPTRWDMDKFRGDVFNQLINPPGGGHQLPVSEEQYKKDITALREGHRAQRARLDAQTERLQNQLAQIADLRRQVEALTVETATGLRQRIQSWFGKF